MRVIILGSKNCPHCRALLKLFRSVNDATISYSYLELDVFFQRLSEEEKLALMKQFQTSPLYLPLVLVRNENTVSWNQLHCEEFTKKLLVRYAKESIQISNVNKLRSR